MTSFWNWLKSALGLVPAVIDDVVPVVADGEAIVVALTKVVSDLKSSNFTSVIADSQVVVTAVQTFAKEVGTVVTQVQNAK